jgi:hypothetical protein
LGKSDGTTVGGDLPEAHVRPTPGHADPADLGKRKGAENGLELIGRDWS